MELAYSGLHRLCAPMLDRLERLPVPQRDALTIGSRSEVLWAILSARRRPARPALLV
jgi:hypothetical protein